VIKLALPRAPTADFQCTDRISGELANSVGRRPPSLACGLDQRIAVRRLAGPAGAKLSPSERRSLVLVIKRPCIHAIFNVGAGEWVGKLPSGDAASAIISDLKMKPTGLRKGPIFSRGTELIPGVEYESLEVAREWPNLLKRYTETLVCPYARAVTAYAVTSICHPLVDGNGALARIMLERELINAGVLRSSTLPLTPELYIGVHLHMNALQALCVDGDWQSYGRIMLEFVKTSFESTVEDQRYLLGSLERFNRR
jgi:hypothetical protein